ncbi:MAG: hypothetical protein HZA51_11905 [Planctomycetes bacterium]|nr:hypothetical protein [Planctomycetota bacterium]
MKRTSMILACGIVAGLAASSIAQDSSIFYDVRDNATSAGTGVGGQLIGTAVWPYTNGQNPVAGGGNSADRFGTAAVNAGQRGAGNVLRLNPVQVSGFHALANPNGAGSGWPNYDADTNAATGRLWLYLSVNDDLSGTGDVISSIGLDHNITNGPNLVTARNGIGAVAFTMFNDATVAAQAGGSPATPWNGVVNGASNLATPPSVLGSKAVRVPVTTGPAYAASLGIQPNAGLYRIGQLRVTAGTRNCTQRSANLHVDNSTYTLKASVNNLLCTRVFQSGGDAVENISMGYDPYVANGTFGTLDAAVSGSVVGTSAAPDAAIQIRLRGDFNGDGNVNALDGGPFAAAITVGSPAIPSAKQSQFYIADFTNDRKVNALDGGAFSKAITASLTCP